MYGGHHCRDPSTLSPDAMQILHEVKVVTNCLLSEKSKLYFLSSNLTFVLYSFLDLYSTAPPIEISQTLCRHQFSWYI